MIIVTIVQWIQICHHLCTQLFYNIRNWSFNLGHIKRWQKTELLEVSHMWMWPFRDGLHLFSCGRALSLPKGFCCIHTVFINSLPIPPCYLWCLHDLKFDHTTHIIFRIPIFITLVYIIAYWSNIVLPSEPFTKATVVIFFPWLCSSISKITFWRFNALCRTNTFGSILLLSHARIRYTSR